MKNQIEISIEELRRKNKKGYTEISVSENEGNWTNYDSEFPMQIRFLLAVFHSKKRCPIFTLQFPNYRLEDATVLEGKEIRENYSRKDFEISIKRHGIKMSEKKSLDSFLN